MSRRERVGGSVLVVGSVNVDIVVRVERLPAPGETVTGGTFERHQGGKGGNQAVASARLRRPTYLMAAVGDDTFGKEARLSLEDDEVDVSGVRAIEGTATGVALIVVDASGENLIAVASGANAHLGLTRSTTRPGRRADMSGHVVLVSREIPAAAVADALAEARRAGALTVLNPAPADGMAELDLHVVDVLSPNRGELALCAGGSVDDPPEVLARRLIAAGVRLAVVVTLGADGALLVPADGPAVHVPGHVVQAIDATGAGDTFSGALAAGLAEGRPIEESVRRANVAAALSTTAHGARSGMPTLKALEAALG
jgi:ribokinase